MAARFAAGDGALAQTVRGLQDAVVQWQIVDKAIIDAVSLPPEKRNKGREANVRRRLAALETQISRSTSKLRTEFPRYFELSSPNAVKLNEVQELLGAKEALLTYVVADQHTFLWVVRKKDAQMHRLNIGREKLDQSVQILRRHLDPENISDLGGIRPFNTTLAFKLYTKLFAPAEPMLKDVRHVFVVPDAGLQSLPLGVLVTKETQSSFTDFSGYRRVGWLAKKYALTTLPSVSSLRAFRTFARATNAQRPFLGVGDPKLADDAGSMRGIKLASLFTTNGRADAKLVRRLPSLPETASELLSLAHSLGVGGEALILGAAATEKRIKTMRLNDHKVIAFATHALVAGDVKGLAEPALVLTPPINSTASDDGLLTASEVAQLKLDADLVILSACNTAGADSRPEADALSGLAKAFFYAGSRALLVSHWPVSSLATVELTTQMLSMLATDPRIGRAEALRRSMMAILNSPKSKRFAHPMFWAPFVVVGEGGGRQERGN